MGGSMQSRLSAMLAGSGILAFASTMTVHAAMAADQPGAESGRGSSGYFGTSGAALTPRQEYGLTVTYSIGSR